MSWLNLPSKPQCCWPSPRHFGGMATCPTDTVCFSSLAVPVMWNRLPSRGHLQAGCTCWCVAIRYGFQECILGKTEWELMLLAALEWAHREGWLILSFYTIHLQSTWLSAFFSTGNLWLPCWISSKPVCYDCKTLPWPPGSRRGGH